MRNKIYILAPLIALVLFAGVFVIWRSHDREVQAQRAATERAEQIAKNEAAAAATKANFAIKLAAQEKRAAERAAREASRKADEAARQALLDQRDDLTTRIATGERDSNRLNTAISAERDAVTSLQREADKLAAEQTVLKELTAKAAANQAAITKLLQQPAPAAVTIP